MSRRLAEPKSLPSLGPATDRDNNLEKVIAAGAKRYGELLTARRKIPKCADKVREIAAKLASCGYFRRPARAKIAFPLLKKAKCSCQHRGQISLDANSGKGEGDKEKSALITKGCRQTSFGDILLLDDGRCVEKCLKSVA